LASIDNDNGPEFSAPTHHPAAELLVDYVSGAHSASEALLIDLHLSFCPECRRSVDVLLATAGEMLDSLPAERLAPNVFNRTLQMLDRMDAVPLPHPPAVPPIPDFAKTWPRPIVRHIARNGLKTWRRMPAGFRALRIPFADPASRVWVMNAPGGRGPLPHGHTRDEWTVVLEGGFTDETGTYNAGDFAFAGPGDEHTMVAEPGEGCVCVLLTRGPQIYTTWLGRLLAPFIEV
jgi:putative transcriptional regulator